ncbi:MAG TPA: PspC domain-containing protein, partial [Actinomycetota bacterium]|nr:PspC domain-containing protein [Actinomycetota bacterium]
MTDERRDESTEPAEPAEPVEPTETEPEAPATEEPPPPPPPAATQTYEEPRRLVRRPEGKMIAGVCTGLAAYMGVDVVAVRIGVVLLAVFTGVGFIGYLVAWLVMPMAPEGAPLPAPNGGARSPFDRASSARWIGVGAIVLGAVILFHNVWDFRGGIFWGVLLVGIGIAVWSREFGGPRPPRNGNRPPVTPSSPTNPIEPPTTPLVSPAQTTPPPAPPGPPPIARRSASPAPAPSPRRREPSVLGRLVVGAAALAVGIAVLSDNIGWLDVTAKGIFAVLLGIVGVGLLVGAWWGRARWLIFPGIVLTIALLFAAVLPTRWVGSYGEVVWQPTTRSELRPLYEHGAGKTVLDLSKLKWGAKDKFVDVRLGFGELLVVVPEDIPVKTNVHVQGGDVTLFGINRSGWDVDFDYRERGDTDLGTLNLDIQLNFGEVTVRDIEPGEEFTQRTG